MDIQLDRYMRGALFPQQPSLPVSRPMHMAVLYVEALSKRLPLTTTLIVKYANLDGSAQFIFSPCSVDQKTGVNAMKICYLSAIQDKIW
jgi:hypothetical protein